MGAFGRFALAFAFAFASLVARRTSVGGRVGSVPECGGVACRGGGEVLVFAVSESVSGVDSDAFVTAVWVGALHVCRD